MNKSLVALALACAVSLSACGSAASSAAPTHGHRCPCRHGRAYAGTHRRTACIG